MDGPSAFLDAADQVGEAVLDFYSGDGVYEHELLEFLAADLDPVPADPAFRERLRDELWEVVSGDLARRGKA